jgi:hypothetical protein
MKNSKKLLSIIILFSFIISICTNCGKHNAKKTKYQNASNESVVFTEDSVKATLKNFYTSYISLWGIMNLDLTNGEKIKINDSLKTVYCSNRLCKLLHDLTNQPILNSDPFINSQMVDTLMLKSLTIKKDSINDNLYIISYTYGGPNTIRLIISKEGSRYKIDSLPDIPEGIIKEVRP